MSRLTHINLAKGFRGGERQTELLIRELAGQGFAQRAVVRRDHPLSKRLAGVDGLQLLPIGKPFSANLDVLRGGFLHAHDGRGAHVAHWAHTWLQCPYVITRRVDNRPSTSFFTRRMYRRARSIAVLSRAIDRVMQAYEPGLSTVRIPSASTGFAVDATHAAVLRAEWGGRFVVGQVGALDDSQKGQRDLIEAARILLAEDDGWRFVIVGGGDDEAMLHRAAAGLEHVTFTGHVDNVGDHMASFDGFAFPSVHEGLGSTLLDAMAMGLPVVASDVDGIPEIVADERQGLLTPPRDPLALAAALRRLRYEPGLAARLGDAGVANARHYTPRAMAERYIDWYDALGVSLAPAATASHTPTTANGRPV